MLIIGHMLPGVESNGFVFAIQYDVSAVRLFFEAVGQEYRPKVT
jgi:hypothetical protein